jgi:hypothetical protein
VAVNIEHLKDYKINDKGTTEEKVFIDYDTTEHYQEKFSQWLHLKNLREELRVWRPCEYFDQLNIASASSHSILNYPIFLALHISEDEILILYDFLDMAPPIQQSEGHARLQWFGRIRWAPPYWGYR